MKAFFGERKDHNSRRAVLCQAGRWGSFLRSSRDRHNPFGNRSWSRWCQGRPHVVRTTLADLIETLIQTERPHRLYVKMRTFFHPSLLIIDDIGFLPITPSGANLFFQLVNARYEKRAMILAFNLRFADRDDMFGGPVMATTWLDRLRHYPIFIRIKGNSYRLRDPLDLVPEHTRTNKSL